MFTDTITTSLQKESPTVGFEQESTSRVLSLRVHHSLSVIETATASPTLMKDISTTRLLLFVVNRRDGTAATAVAAVTVTVREEDLDAPAAATAEVTARDAAAKRAALTSDMAVNASANATPMPMIIRKNRKMLPSWQVGDAPDMVRDDDVKQPP